jgi:hypothetical protein
MRCTSEGSRQSRNSSGPMIPKLTKLPKLTSVLKLLENSVRLLTETDRPLSETDQRNCPAAESRYAGHRRSHRLRPRPPERWSAAAMSALPLIEAVQRAGGAITLQGNRLRLSAPEPLPQNLLQELRTRKAEVIHHLQHARQSGLTKPARRRSQTARHCPPRWSWNGLQVWPASAPCRRPGITPSTPGSS